MAHRKVSSLTRRHFLQGLASTPLILGVTSAQAENDPDVVLELQANRRVPALQTWADEDSALVVVLGNEGWSFNCVGSATTQVRVLKTQKIGGTNLLLYKLEIVGLSSSHYSLLQIFNAQDKILDMRKLKGLDLSKPHPKIAVASCANYRKLDNQRVMYEHVYQQNPDLVFFIGDIVYCDSKGSSLLQIPEDPNVALQRFVTTWNTVDLYQLDPLIPTLAVWDDHDYGANGGDSSHPHKAAMKSMFRSFYAMPERHERLSYGPGVSFRLTAFGIDFHMMDDRTEKIPGRTLWGTRQEAWLSNEFSKSKNPAWILNGVQFFRYFMMIESMERHAPPTLEMLRRLLRTHKKPTLLVSGDVHCSQLQELPSSLFGFKTYELTSSGIHCSSAGQILKRKASEGQLFYCGKDNFMIVQPSLHPEAMDLVISCANEDGVASLFQGPLRIAV